MKYKYENLEKLKEAFENHGWNIELNKSSNISLCAKTENGVIINCYSNGNINTQGKEHKDDLDKLKQIVNHDLITEEYKDKNNKKVFIVHGHDELSISQLQVLLFQFGLTPVVNREQASQGMTLIESLINDMKECLFGIVLLTPDDYGYSKKQGSDNIQPRVRQNVLLEMGMLIGLLGRDKIAVLRKAKIEDPTDMNGVIYKSYIDNIAEVKDLLRKEFKKAGLDINE